jgi:hypothetical protein
MSRFRAPSRSIFWSVDLDTRVVSHVSGFVARIQPLPMSDMDLRAVSSDGLTAVATVSANDGRWAVLADSASRTRAAEWFRETVEAEAAEISLRRLAREGAEAWLEARAT